MFSYWEQKNFFGYDLIVIGSGFTGLSTAINYKKKKPKASVLVLEKGVFPTGASTKNAGFACFGSLTEILDDFWGMSPKEVTALVERRYMGLQQIRKNFGDARLRYQHTHGFELLEAENIAAADQIGEVNKMLKKLFKKDVFSLVKRPEKLGFSDRVKLVVENNFEGELDPGAYLGALWEKASLMGIRILTGVSVVEVQKDEGIVLAENSGKNKVFEFKGEKVAICTNAFSKKLWPESELEPGRGLVLLSKPLAEKLPWKGSFHMDKGFVYFREIDGRLLLGGARNKDFEKEKSLDFETNPKIKSHLENLAKEVILPGKNFEWDMEWTGIMAFGPKKSPLIQSIGKKTAVAVRLGGMGVAIGWQVGKELSQLLSKM
ncbi:Glycine/D-amino acid oxidase [Algoriphagus alkaliphilus]|uniref:Glycine/D-amino acid oxidase n=1 Tax=Algoriphagus alkaliphilus TaxID=279824 RepID=A0A1G5VMY1_9BACT|nr:FAD-dependent oxidoreductase [Algoriphagus alkaliphilus]MBA4301432.1 FAD-binding oxidoreductase [Cyclobacterium sp.]SDA47210.1 Glycine/D-amino acid oxidase [Algoriphagus alkaliphilus]